MGRRTYTDKERSHVLVELTVNDGNVARTSRATGVPETVVREWKKKWEKDGPPEAVTQTAVDEAQDFVDQATATRYEAMVLLRAKLGDANPRELATIVGILDDKITRARGLATGRVEHVHTEALPPPEEMGQMVGSYIARAISAARQRNDEVIEVVAEPAGEPLALGTGQEEEK